MTADVSLLAHRTTQARGNSFSLSDRVIPSYFTLLFHSPSPSLSLCLAPNLTRVGVCVYVCLCASGFAARDGARKSVSVCVCA